MQELFIQDYASLGRWVILMQELFIQDYVSLGRWVLLMQELFIQDYVSYLDAGTVHSRLC